MVVFDKYIYQFYKVSFFNHLYIFLRCYIVVIMFDIFTS